MQLKEPAKITPLTNLVALGQLCKSMICLRGLQKRVKSKVISANSVQELKPQEESLVWLVYMGDQ